MIPEKYKRKVFFSPFYDSDRKGENFSEIKNYIVVQWNSIFIQWFTIKKNLVKMKKEVKQENKSSVFFHNKIISELCCRLFTFCKNIKTFSENDMAV